MSRKLILDIYEAFADQLNVEYKKPLVDKNFQEIITSLNNIDVDIEENITEYESAIKSFSYMKREMEMRIKFPDIWEMQLQEARGTMASTKFQLIELGTKHKTDIAQIFKNHDNKTLSLDDFSEII